ncbi:hypothetical protein [Streptomyces sp. NBC_00687]|uniref:hypothetical protein n=1 Tax=Streptomyces sp. NBC_00687 TaxID=2975807 RepID=UPI0022599931|nr:hypothetical protein [Streptomyces sp. NBC_00687]MCX4920089.1 hypothetical protein [Streptomyces sp. NBC_00687]
MAGRSGQYYRAGHWVNRSDGKGTRAKKSGTGVVVVGLLIVGAWMGFFSPDASSSDKPAPEPSPVSAPSGH